MLSFGCQFHQHLMSSFLARKCFEHLICAFFGGFVIFWQKEIDPKADRKMWLKLTAVGKYFSCGIVLSDN